MKSLKLPIEYATDEGDHRHHNNPIWEEQKCDIISPSSHQVEGAIDRDNESWIAPSDTIFESAVAMTRSHLCKFQVGMCLFCF